MLERQINVHDSFDFKQSGASLVTVLCVVGLQTMSLDGFQVSCGFLNIFVSAFENSNGMGR